MINKNDYLEALAGIKVIVLFLIILAHLGVSFGNFNVSSRCVEFFFVMSGFLYGYTKKNNTLNEGYPWNKLVKWITKVYPIYFIGWLYFTVLSRPSIQIALCNLFMLQAWSMNGSVVFSLNGPSWYIAALFFCTFMAPIVMSIIQKTKKAWLVVICVLAFRMFLEFLAITSPDVIPISLHNTPFLRLTDYSIGMIFGIYREQIALHINKRMITLGEIVSLLTLILLDCYCGDTLPSTIFVIICSIIILLLSFGYGLVAKLLSIKPLVFLNKYQLEMYLFSAVCASFVKIFASHFMPSLAKNYWLMVIIICALVVAISISFKAVYDVAKKYLFNRSNTLQ